MKVKLDIGICVAEAWRGFKGWWIPLCIVAAMILFSQSWLPQWLLADSIAKFEPYKQACVENASAIVSGEKTVTQACEDFIQPFTDPVQSQEFLKALKNLAIRTGVVAGVLLVPIAFMLLLMIIFSKASVQTSKEDITLKRDMSRSILTSFSYIFLAVLKMIGFALWVIPLTILGFGKPESPALILTLLLLIPVLFAVSCVFGPWLYVKLFFTGFIITEESMNPITAIVQSWRMTRGNFFRVFFIFIIMLAIDAATIPTVIGVIPGNSFCYTLRAAAYKQLKLVLQ
jgi:hypothetical protein